jgi:hypothetical protein
MTQRILGYRGRRFSLIRKEEVGEDRHTGAIPADAGFLHHRSASPVAREL